MKNKSILALVILALGASTFFSLAQDDNDGPGGPPPGDFGNDGPDGFGGPGGPPPDENGGDGPGMPGDFNRNDGPGGRFDPAQFEQHLLAQARENLNVTNADEWAVIQPLVQKVLDARKAVHDSNGPGIFGPPNGPNGSSTTGSKERQALQSNIDAQAPYQQVRAALSAYQAARQGKQAALATAQDNLKNVLNLRQAAEAVLLGLAR